MIELKITPLNEMTIDNADGHLVNNTLTIYHQENNYLLLSAERTIPLQGENILKSEHFIIKISLQNAGLPVQEVITPKIKSDDCYENILAFLYEQEQPVINEVARPTAFAKSSKPLPLLEQYFQPPAARTAENIAITHSLSESPIATSLITGNGNILRDLGLSSEQESPNNMQEYYNFLQQPSATNFGYQDE